MTSNIDDIDCNSLSKLKEIILDRYIDHRINTEYNDNFKTNIPIAIILKLFMNNDLGIALINFKMWLNNEFSKYTSQFYIENTNVYIELY